ncbi:hypothetical protein [Sediminibacter sp. Hel_I_10]|uniref:hypothetical protein n=1 Tax=Sediminibacter sp. Hel_I_10 TaxID=1392490 RepID=UPI0004798521|nr:hypothetical protein [Sediminibacter sp. Hel_I_10]
MNRFSETTILITILFYSCDSNQKSQTVIQNDLLDIEQTSEYRDLEKRLSNLEDQIEYLDAENMALNEQLIICDSIASMLINK